ANPIPGIRSPLCAEDRPGGPVGGRDPGRDPNLSPASAALRPSSSARERIPVSPRLPSPAIPGTSGLPPRAAPKIVIFCPNLIGDTVMATPTLRALRRGFAGSFIAGVIKPHVSPTLDGSGWLDERIPFDPRAGREGLGARALLRRLRSGRFDLAIVLPNSFRT